MKPLQIGKESRGKQTNQSHSRRKSFARTELSGRFIVTPNPFGYASIQAEFVGCLGLEAALLKSHRCHPQSCLWVGSSHLGTASDPYRNTNISQSSYRVWISVLKGHTKNKRREQSHHPNTFSFTLRCPKGIKWYKECSGTSQRLETSFKVLVSHLAHSGIQSHTSVPWRDPIGYHW